MEVRYLIYTGNKVDGNVVVRQESRLSPHRTLKVSPGKRWEIGRQIPELTARRIIAQLSMLFKVESVTVDDRMAIVRTLTEMYEKFDKSINEKGSTEVVAYAAVEALCATFSNDAIRPVLQALRDAADGDDDQMEVITETFHDVISSDEPAPSISALKPVETAVEEENENSDIDPSTEVEPSTIEEGDDDDEDEDPGPDDTAVKGKKKKSKKAKKKK